MINNKLVAVFFTLLFVAFSGNVVAEEEISIASHDYSPYLQIGGTGFVNVSEYKWGAGLDLFIPLWQRSPSHLVFTDVRLYDRFKGVFEGNVHVGYRYLSENETRLHGAYCAFDRKRTGFGNYFNQLTVGVESWFNELFIGANFYQPIGETLKKIGITESFEIKSSDSNSAYKNVLITPIYYGEKSMGGGDFEVGYEFIKGFVGYVGGYYFKDTKMSSIYGPKARISYDYFLDNGQKVLKIFNKIGLEAGIQRDKPRGTTGYLGLNFKVAMMPNNKCSNLSNVSRHMVDLVRRDVDIVTSEGIIEIGAPKNAQDKNGKEVTIIDLDIISPSDLQQIINNLNNIKGSIIFLGKLKKVSNMQKILKSSAVIKKNSEISVFSPFTGRNFSTTLVDSLGNRMLNLEQLQKDYLYVVDEISKLTSANTSTQTFVDKLVGYTTATDLFFNEIVNEVYTHAKLYSEPISHTFYEVVDQVYDRTKLYSEKINHNFEKINHNFYDILNAWLVNKL
jgi:hypothetical protein